MINVLMDLLKGLNPTMLALIRGSVGVMIIASFVSLNVLFLTWGERKVMARFQARYGPNRAGPFGLLQSLADGAKLIGKEDIVPANADKIVHTLAPALAFAFALLPAVAIPFSKNMVVSDLNVGVLYVIAVSSLSTITLLMGGWGSNNKYSLLGGMRAVAQSLSYEIPLVLSTIGVIALAGSLSLVDIVNAQERVWYVFLQPLAFIVFFIASIAEMARIPFDLPVSESELVAGFHTEYSGMKFALWLFAEYTHLVLASMLIVLLFLGGWNIPFISPFIAILPTFVSSIFEATILIGKMYGVIFFLMLTRSALPRIKITQMLDIGWKNLIPLALLNITVTGLVLAW